MKTLISLCRCAGWSESLLGAHTVLEEMMCPIPTPVSVYSKVLSRFFDFAGCSRFSLGISPIFWNNFSHWLTKLHQGGNSSGYPQKGFMDNKQNINSFLELWISLLAPNFKLHLSSALLFLNKLSIGKKFICKAEDWMSDSVDLDEMAHYERSYLDLRCLQKPIITKTRLFKYMENFT